MPQDLMLDPSLLLSRDTFALVLQGWERGELIGVTLPQSFAVAAIRGELTDRCIRFYGGRLPLTDQRILMQFIERSSLIENLEDRSGEIPGNFVRRLATVAQDDLLFRTLQEEWLFLTGHSWVASRIRRPFSAFLRAGAVAIEWGGKKLDQVAARTLKIPATEMPIALTPGQRVRAGAKWVGVAGSSPAALLDPIVGAVASTAAGVFALLDP